MEPRPAVGAPCAAPLDGEWCSPRRGWAGALGERPPSPLWVRPSPTPAGGEQRSMALARARPCPRACSVEGEYRGTAAPQFSGAPPSPPRSPLPPPRPPPVIAGRRHHGSPGRHLCAPPPALPPPVPANGDAVGPPPFYPLGEAPLHLSVLNGKVEVGGRGGGWDWVGGTGGLTAGCGGRAKVVWESGGGGGGGWCGARHRGMYASPPTPTPGGGGSWGQGLEQREEDQRSFRRPPVAGHPPLRCRGRGSPPRHWCGPAACGGRGAGRPPRRGGVVWRPRGGRRGRRRSGYLPSLLYVGRDTRAGARRQGGALVGDAAAPNLPKRRPTGASDRRHPHAPPPPQSIDDVPARARTS